MLIYNSQKEFIGMDEADLGLLGFSNLAQLRSESADFADLFVKTPGYIHNFKHVHWIDFIVCADSAETPKVIIHANEKNYRCNINITTAYLTDSPTTKAYLVNLQNLRELSRTESSNISNDIQEKPIPVAAHEEVTPFNAATPSSVAIPAEPAIIEDSYETPKEEFTQDIDDNPSIVQDQYDDAPLDIKLENDDTPLEIEIEDDFKLDIEEEISQDILLQETVATDSLNIEDDDDDEYNKDYIFDPHLASDELGLPIDLIEEFIEDFIAQAKEFKNGLYDSLKDGDMNNVKILSHKLKGVAANLRIEDAFEVLTIINTSADTNVIHKNLNYLYKIVSKLAGEKITKTVNAVSPSLVTTKEEESIEDDFILDFKEVDEEPDTLVSEPKIEEDEDVLSLDFKEEEEEDLYMDYEVNIDDSEVPQIIDIPELADDDFISNETVDAIKIDDEELNVDLETIDEEELSKELSEIDDLPDLLEIEEEVADLNKLEELNQEVSIEEEVADLDKLEELNHKVNTEEENAPDEETTKISYDKTEVANEIGIDSDSFNELFEDYIGESKELSSSILDAVNDNDAQRWKYATLKLKGMSDNMRVHDFTSELELLLQTDNADEALSSANKVSSIISKISNVEA